MQIFIKETANRHGVGIQELAKRLGVSRQAVNYYCQQGDKNPVAQLERIAEAIGCKVEEFFSGNRPDVSTFVCPNCGKRFELAVKPEGGASDDGKA